ncbi:MAG: hypothetical protein AAGG01_06085, partial [Planctomycetota bacterium]
MQITPIVPRAAFVLVLAGVAPAQSLNIDIGMNLAFFAGIPDASYAAGSGQSGEWNGFMPTSAATELLGLDGMPSGVTLRS